MQVKSILIITIISLFFSCQANNSNSSKDSNQMKSKEKDLSQYQRAYFASGCFWCVEAIFESVEGVEEAVSGYAGGKEQNPTYKAVSAGLTGHTEAVEVYYDSSKVSFETLVTVFYGSHNPTTVDGQYPDFGKQYRSAIFYINEEQQQIAKYYKSNLDKSGAYDEPIATEISALTTFWKAEEYHQNYERLNPNQSYVKSVSVPRLNKFKANFPELLKKNAP